MGAFHSLTQHAATKWSWLIACWRSRLDVLQLADELTKAGAEARSLRNDLKEERESRHLLELELNQLKAKAKEQDEEFQIAKDGNRALLRFVHTRHRLAVKFDPETIRGYLQKIEQAR